MTRCPPGSGGEDFGGSLTQGIDGKVYVQAGKNAVWNLELGNLDRIRIVGAGVVILKPEEQSLARAESRSSASGPLASRPAKCGG